MEEWKKEDNNTHAFNCMDGSKTNTQVEAVEPDKVEDLVEKAVSGSLSKASQVGRYTRDKATKPKRAVIARKPLSSKFWHAGDKWKERAVLDKTIQDNDVYLDDLQSWIENVHGSYVKRLEILRPDIDVVSELWNVYSYFKRQPSKRVDTISSYVETWIKRVEVRSDKPAEVEPHEEEDEDEDRPYIPSVEETRKQRDREEAEWLAKQQK